MPSSRSLFQAIESFFKTIDMVRVLWVLKTFGLIHIRFFIEAPIEKYTIDIHLKQFKFSHTSYNQEYSYAFKSCNRSKFFININSFNLLEPLSNQPCFICHNHSIFIYLIFENPFCSSDIHIF